MTVGTRRPLLSCSLQAGQAVLTSLTLLSVTGKIMTSFRRHDAQTPACECIATAIIVSGKFADSHRRRCCMFCTCHNRGHSVYDDKARAVLLQRLSHDPFRRVSRNLRVVCASRRKLIVCARVVQHARSKHADVRHFPMSAYLEDSEPCVDDL